MKMSPIHRLTHPGRVPGTILATLTALVTFAACETPPLPRPSTETYVTIDGFKTRYRAKKGPENCQILYLHGFAASVETWKELFDRLPAGCSVAAIDHIGFGIADRPPAGRFSYNPAGYAEYALKFMSETGIEHAFIAGNSMGGAIAMTMARQAPERVDGLILMDPKYQDLDLPPPFLLLKAPALAEVAFTFMTPMAMKMGLQRAYYDNDLVTPALVHRYRDTLDYPGSVQAWAAAFRGLMKWSSDWTPTEVPKITQPALIIWGKEDLLLPPSDAGLLHKAIRQSELVMLDSCGHVPQEEKAAETADLIEHFIQKTLAGRNTGEIPPASANAATVAGTQPEAGSPAGATPVPAPEPAPTGTQP